MVEIPLQGEILVWNLIEVKRHDILGMIIDSHDKGDTNGIGEKKILI